jgi:hypothetical protein
VKSSLEQVLDTCIAQLNSGEDLETVLAAHPDAADELRPMLVAAALVRIDVPPPVHKMERKEAFLAAVAGRRREVEVTEGYVVELKAGVPVAELLLRARPELRPLIRAAWRMQTTPAPDPSDERMREGKARLMAMVAARQAAARRAASPTLLDRSRVVWSGVLAGLHPSPTRARRVWSGVTAVVMTALIIGGGAVGVGTAAASSLPGDSLYQVKELGRSAQLLFAFDPAERAALQVRFSGQRLSEIEQLARNGREVPIDMLEQWLRGQSRALADIQLLPSDQRQLLIERLARSVGDRDAIAGMLREVVRDARALDALLASPDAVWNQPRGGEAAVDTVTTPVPPGAARPEAWSEAEVPAGRNATVPAPVGAQASPRGEPPQVVAPAPVAVPPADQTDPSAQYVQSGDDGDRERHKRPDPVRDVPPASTEPPAVATEPPTPQQPPAYNQPIFEEPTDTPEPAPGATQQAPPSSGQGAPPAPVPSESPAPQP